MSRVKVFCFFYNESFLIPFFLRHYQYADIHAFVSKSIDSTVEMLQAAPNVIVENVEFPQGLDDEIKTNTLNNALNKHDSKHDWHICVDSDEFIWPQGMNPLLFPDKTPEFLDSISSKDNCVMARMWNVYRNKEDSDLNPLFPVSSQRRHGVPEFHIWYEKKIIFRSNLGINLSLGNHSTSGGVSVSPIEFRGAHWQNADPSFCVMRRVRDRSNHISLNNKSKGYGVQHFDLSEEKIMQECRNHENDPIVF